MLMRFYAERKIFALQFYFQAPHSSSYDLETETETLRQSSSHAGDHWSFLGRDRTGIGGD